MLSKGVPEFKQQPSITCSTSLPEIASAFDAVPVKLETADDGTGRGIAPDGTHLKGLAVGVKGPHKPEELDFIKTS